MSDIPMAIEQAAIPHINDFKCPQCKAYALYVKGGTVLCRKCGYSATLPGFARSVMKLRQQDGAWVLSIPDIFGGDDTIVHLQEP